MRLGGCGDDHHSIDPLRLRFGKREADHRTIRRADHDHGPSNSNDVQGGGNDATQRATDAQITSNAERLLAALKKRYPGTTLAMIGTLARGVSNGGGRRTEIDALLGRIAAKHGIPFVSAGDWLTRYNAIGDLQDGVHLKPAGHAKLGAALAREFTSLGLTARPDSSASASESAPESAPAQ